MSKPQLCCRKPIHKVRWDLRNPMRVDIHRITMRTSEDHRTCCLFRESTTSELRFRYDRGFTNRTFTQHRVLKLCCKPQWPTAACPMDFRIVFVSANSPDPMGTKHKLVARLLSLQESYEPIISPPHHKYGCTGKKYQNSQFVPG